MKMLRDLFAKFQFWRARKLENEKDYRFMLDLSQGKDSFAIRIERKKWQGVIVEYSDIEFGPDNQMNFNIDIIANPNLKNVESKAFKRFTSDIFRNILAASVEAAARGTVNETRTFDPVEFDEERDVHEEDVAVPKKRVSKRKSRKKTV